MLRQLDGIPDFHNILAFIFSLLLFVGYAVLTGTFTSLRNYRMLADGTAMVVKAVQNRSLLAVAVCFRVAGVIGMLCLGWVWRVNYVWLVNRLIL